MFFVEQIDNRRHHKRVKEKLSLECGGHKTRTLFLRREAISNNNSKNNNMQRIIVLLWLTLSLVTTPLVLGRRSSQPVQDTTPPPLQSTRNWAMGYPYAWGIPPGYGEPAITKKDEGKVVKEVKRGEFTMFCHLLSSNETI